MGEVKKRELFSRDVPDFRDKPLGTDTACLNDVVEVLGRLSEYSATLEYQNSDRSAVMAVKTVLELERVVILLKKRMREVRAEIALNKK